MARPRIQPATTARWCSSSNRGAYPDRTGDWLTPLALARQLPASMLRCRNEAGATRLLELAWALLVVGAKVRELGGDAGAQGVEGDGAVG